MSTDNIEAKIEAILFTMGEAVELKRISLAIGINENETKKIIKNMMNKYEDENRGIKIVEIDDSFQMCTKEDTYDTLINLINIPKKHILTDILLETLSIIAYKQPITKMEIEAIRGVKSDHAINKLIEYNLVCEVGRKETIGRPIIFGTTKDFLRCFGISSIDELPVIDQLKLEDFKLEAEEEAQLKLNL